MSKLQVKFICQECGAQYPRWTGRCQECGNWNTLTEEVLETAGPRKASTARSASVIEISKVDAGPATRFSTGISEFDQVLGGGVVPGSLILLGGDPGIGKSTIILQVAAKIKDTLYISGEESERQIQMRANRLGIKSGINLATETNIETVIATILSRKTTGSCD